MYMLLELMRDARQAIIEGRYQAFAAEFLADYQR
jgi:queuine/archaeosine tRNA-ribosyltransferase